MRTKTCILAAIALFVLSGCVSRKTAVKDNVKLATVENVNKSEKETVEQSNRTDVSKETKTSTTDKSIIRTTETEYSEPDESGNQHKTRETVTETKNDISVLNEENEQIISEQRSEIERLSVDNSRLRTQLEASRRETTKTSTRLPIWTYIAAFIVGGVLVLILRSWLKGIFSR